jgi:hypothetical protein
VAVTRRQLALGGFALFGLGVDSPEARTARVRRVFGQYDAQGVHRTGTQVDERSAHWLADEIRAAGLEPRLVPFALRRVDPLEATVTLEGERFEGVPLFDAAFTDAAGVEGRLGTPASDAPIAMAKLPPVWAAPAARELAEARREERHEALVIVSDGPSYGMPAGLTLLNADSFAAPFGPPSVQIPSQAGPALLAAAQAGARVRVVCHARRTRVEAYNVETQVAGTDPAAAPIVVMTPRSGWWQCASERGGGLACWLELIRNLARRAPRREVRFIASSGHELGHLGLEDFLARRAALVKSARVWIHLGANFAAAVEPSVRLQASDEELASLARAALDQAGAPADVETPVGTRPLGEAQNVFDGGGRYVSILGGNGLFHHPQDRWPQAVDVAKTVRIVDGFVKLVRELAS